MKSRIIKRGPNRDIILNSNILGGRSYIYSTHFKEEGPVIVLADLNTEIRVMSLFTVSGGDTFATASGGTAPYTYTISAGALPTGLSLNAATGEVTGTTNLINATYTVTIRATDADGYYGQKEYIMQVNEFYNMRDRVQADGSDIIGILGDAYKQWFIDIQTSRTKMYRFSRLLTDDFSGSFNPAILNNDGTTSYLGNNKDTNSGFVSSAWDPSGLLGDGVNYLDTGFNLQTHLTQDSITLAVMNTETASALTKEIGAETGGGVSAYVLVNFAGLGGCIGTANDFTNDVTGLIGIGLTGVTRTGAAAKRIYTSGGSATFGTASLGEINQKVFVFATNVAGLASMVSSRLLQGYIIGSGFTLTDFQTIDAANVAFNTTIGL